MPDHKTTAALKRILNTVSIPTIARVAKPFDVDEIDRHPDCDRIWATIAVLRGYDS